jgi:hypothetical protein
MRLAIAISLTTLLATACGGAGFTEADRRSLTTPRTELPTELTGRWSTGSVGNINYYNPSTGQWAAPSGTGAAYVFDAEGYYEESGILQSSVYSCTTTIYFYKVGTVALETGADGLTTMHLYPGYSRTKSEDNCNAKFNYERDGKLDEEVISIAIGDDEYGIETLETTSQYGTAKYRRGE